MIIVQKHAFITRVSSQSLMALFFATCLLALSIPASNAADRKDGWNQNTWQNTQAAASGRSFSGMASYYGNEAGGQTASGQRYDKNGLTAAHRTLPFGTQLKVTHAGRSVIVTVNDRGPFIRSRVLDLSTGAAKVIGLTGRGVGRVVAEVQ
jgi:rare lipoprotein A